LEKLVLGTKKAVYSIQAFLIPVLVCCLDTLLFMGWLFHTFGRYLVHWRCGCLLVSILLHDRGDYLFGLHSFSFDLCSAFMTG